MKRILLGFAALVMTVGVGSAGVYVAHVWMPQAPVADVAEQGPVATSRDMTPIPLSRRADYDQPAVSEPLAARTRDVEAEPVAVQRYQPAVDPRDVPPQDDIPNANQIAASDDGAGIRAPRQRLASGEPRYAEQPVAAQLPEADPTDGSLADEPVAAEDEPQRIAVSAVKRQVDRYGRPIAAPRNRLRAEEATVEEPAAEEPVAEDPSPQESAADEPQSSVENAPSDNSPGDIQPSTEDGTGRPGDPQLSGSQAPALTIEKIAPPEIQIGKPAKFLIKVRNAGSATAHGVEIHDVIPQGTQLIETRPPATRGAQGDLVWQLGALKPGEEAQAELQLMPTAEGEVGSVATVQFRAEASVRTMATKPMLSLELSGPAKVMKGDEVKLKVKIANPGTGAATGVILSESVPSGLTHSAGTELEFDVGTLKPGESRE
jgi:uncharacterized repeat protein (TIGR01451 family)